MVKIQQRIACKALIQHKGKVLILREAPTYKDGTNIGKFHMPGGRIEVGEPFMDGLAREVLEETGLTIKVGMPIYVGEWFPKIRDVQNQIIAVFFMCEASSETVQLSSEHDKYEWIAPETYSKYNLMTPEDKVIQTYIDLQKKLNAS